MIEEIKQFAKKILEKTDKKEILIVSHFDTDGITSASIFARALKKLDKKFSFQILKSLDAETVQKLPKTKIIVFLDLGSSNIEQISLMPNIVFVIDHHDIKLNFSLPENINLINPKLNLGAEEMSASCLTYLVSRELAKKDTNMADLALIGMVGDMMEKKIGPLVNSIISDCDVSVKKGLLLYPSTRPLNKALEYCSNPYIPGVTGNAEGSLNVLREHQ